MKIIKFAIISLFIISIFSCNSKNEEQNAENDENTENDSIVITNISEEISKIPVKKFPINFSREELAKMDSSSTIFINDKVLEAQTNLVYDEYKALFITSLNNNLSMLFISTKSIMDESYTQGNYRCLILKNGNILSISDPFETEYENDYRKLLSISVINNAKEPELELLYESNVTECLDTTGLGLTPTEKKDLLSDKEKYKINALGEINWEENQVVPINKVKPSVFEGKIGDYNVVMQLFRTTEIPFYNYGKIYVKNNNTGILMGQDYTPEMCFSRDFPLFSSDGKLIGGISFVNMNEIYGHFKNEINSDEKLAVRMKESEQSFEDLVPNSVLSKIKNNEFKNYISHFAESKGNFTLNQSRFDNDGFELTSIAKNFKQKFINEKLLVSAFKIGMNEFTYNYGYVFDNDSSITCIIPVKISYFTKEKGKYRFMFIDYSYEGVIKSIDIIDNLPKTLKIRGYIPESDEPKDMFVQGTFGNENWHKLNFYIDIPAEIDIDSLIVYEQTGQDYTKTENEKSQIFSDKIHSFKHPHLYSFNLTGNLGCNDLYFEIKDSKGKIILNEKLDIHCGE